MIDNLPCQLANAGCAVDFEDYMPLRLWLALAGIAYVFCVMSGLKLEASFLLLALCGLTFIWGLQHIQQGDNYIVWNIVTLTVGVVGGLEAKNFHPPTRLKRSERRAMRQLFEKQWWRVFTNDPRLSHWIQINWNFGVLKL